MNIDVEFINGNDEKLNTMMAGGDLPDLNTFDQTLATANEGSKFALPLNKLSDKYDPFFLETAAKKETVKWYTENDGNIYGYPSFSTTNADYEAGNVQVNQIFIVRKDIYEKIGSPDMSTPEGFLSAMKKAKEVQPKADDGSNMITFGSSAIDIANGGDGVLGKFLQDFLSIPLIEDGKFYDRDSDPEYVAWLEVLRQAYNEGYITNDQFSDSDNTTKEKLTQGKYFAFMHGDTKGLNEFMANNNARNPEETYIAVDGPKNSKGEDSKFSGGTIGGWTQTFITKNTKEPQKAMELLTYLASEYGTMVATFGVEGDTYEIKDNQAVLTEKTMKLRDTDSGAFDKEIGLGSYWQVSNENYAMEMGQKPAKPILQMIEWSSDKAAPRFEVENIDPKTDSAARNLTKIDVERVQAIVSVIQSSSESEGQKIWQDFLNNRDNNGWKEIVEYRNDGISENVKKLK